MRTVLLALACLGALPVAAKEPTVYVTRHHDTPAGQSDPDLLPAGRTRAAHLAQALNGKSIKRIFVSDFKRTRQTAAPLADAEHIPVETYDPADTPAIVARARAAKRTVLIVGHSNTVPDIVEQLGGDRPEALRHEDFGDLWAIRGGKSARTRIDP